MRSPTRDSLRRAEQACPNFWQDEVERVALAIDLAVDERTEAIWRMLRHALGPGTHQQTINAVIDEMRAEYVAAITSKDPT